MQSEFQELINTLTIDQNKAFASVIQDCASSYINESPNDCLFMLGAILGCLKMKIKELSKEENLNADTQ